MFSVLSHLHDCGDEGNDSHNDAPFAEHYLRRSAKRRRQQSSQHQQRQRSSQYQQRQESRAAGSNTTQRQVVERGVGSTAQSRGKVMVTGKSKHVPGEKFVAAKSIVKKAVFCIDSLNTSVTADDVKKFVTGHMSVSVFSCFSVKPRRRRHESEPIKDRTAFRLCIVEKDRDLLLDESKWPDSVIVSEWFHAKRANRRPESNGAETESDLSMRMTIVSDTPSCNETDDIIIYGTAKEIAECMDLNTVDDHGD